MGTQSNSAVGTVAPSITELVGGVANDLISRAHSKNGAFSFHDN